MTKKANKYAKWENNTGKDCTAPGETLCRLYLGSSTSGSNASIIIAHTEYLLANSRGFVQVNH